MYKVSQTSQYKQQVKLNSDTTHQNIIIYLLSIYSILLAMLLSELDGSFEAKIQNRKRPGGGGGVNVKYPWVEKCGPAPQALTR